MTTASTSKSINIINLSFVNSYVLNASGANKLKLFGQYIVDKNKEYLEVINHEISLEREKVNNEIIKKNKLLSIENEELKKKTESLKNTVKNNSIKIESMIVELSKKDLVIRELNNNTNMRNTKFLIKSLDKNNMTEEEIKNTFANNRRPDELLLNQDESIGSDCHCVIF